MLKSLSFGNNIDKAKEIIEEFHPKLVCCLHNSDLIILEKLFPDVEYCIGDIGLQQIVSLNVDNPVVINALVGAIGLMPTAVLLKMVVMYYLLIKKRLLSVEKLLIKWLKKKRLK